MMNIISAEDFSSADFCYHGVCRVPMPPQGGLLCHEFLAKTRLGVLNILQNPKNFIGRCSKIDEYF